MFLLFVTLCLYYLHCCAVFIIIIIIFFSSVALSLGVQGWYAESKYAEGVGEIFYIQDGRVSLAVSYIANVMFEIWKMHETSYYSNNIALTNNNNNNHPFRQLFSLFLYFFITY